MLKIQCKLFNMTAMEYMIRSLLFSFKSDSTLQTQWPRALFELWTSAQGGGRVVFSLPEEPYSLLSIHTTHSYDCLHPSSREDHVSWLKHLLKHVHSFVPPCSPLCHQHLSHPGLGWLSRDLANVSWSAKSCDSVVIRVWDGQRAYCVKLKHLVFRASPVSSQLLVS